MKTKLVMAYYGRLWPGQARLDFPAWWREQETLANEMGLDLTHISATFVENRNRLSDHKAYRLPHARKKFQGECEAGNIKSLDVLSVVTKPDGYIAYDWDLTAGFGTDPACDLLSFIGIDIDHLANPGRLFPQGLLQSTFSRDRVGLSIGYGFAVSMPRDFGPAGYVIGLGSYGAPDYFSYDANAWDQFAGKQFDRRLRNVFGYNVLNRKHLRIRIGNERLEEWITRSPSRGRLHKVGKGLFVWTFARSDDDTEFLAWDYSPVERVRRELEAFCVFPWQEIVE